MPEDKIPETSPKPQFKSLRTYKGDVEEAITKNNYSTSSIFLAEQKKKDSTLIVPQKPESGARNKFFILVGGILLLLGIVTLASIFFLKSNQKEVVIKSEAKTITTFSKEKILPIVNVSRDNLIGSILSEKQSFNLTVNSLLYINPINASGTPADVSFLLSILAPSMPPSLVRSFDADYMLGIYSFDTNEVFLILRTSDYASSFAGMLKWEENIPSDFVRLFSIPENYSTTTRVFKDESLKNKDLRVLKDESGKSVILYSFIDRNTLLITKNESIFGAILSKYFISKQT